MIRALTPDLSHHPKMTGCSFTRHHPGSSPKIFRLPHFGSFAYNPLEGCRRNWVSPVVAPVSSRHVSPISQNSHHRFPRLRTG